MENLADDEILDEYTSLVSFIYDDFAVTPPSRDEEKRVGELYQLILSRMRTCSG